MQKPEVKLKNCLSWKKPPIKIALPSPQLADSFDAKSRNAIRTMDMLRRDGNTEWTLDTSYYARYFAVYSILAKLGVQCNDHQCTIALFAYLFRDKNLKTLVDELDRSRRHRVEAQYYPLVKVFDLDEIAQETKNFVLSVQELVDSLDSGQLRELRAQVEELRNALDRKE
jgi:uncharacterized protein (UPF0332 family)